MIWKTVENPRRRGGFLKVTGIEYFEVVGKDLYLVATTEGIHTEGVMYPEAARPLIKLWLTATT